MTTKSTKKKATKKTGKTQQNAVGAVGGGYLLAQAPKPKPFSQAVKDFDAAVAKVAGIRSVLLGSDNDSWEVTAYRAARLQRVSHEVTQAAFYLEQSAQAEADK